MIKNEMTEQVVVVQKRALLDFIYLLKGKNCFEKEKK